MGWSPDCEGFNVHEIRINAPVKWHGKTGSTTLIEYIDSDMGLIAGREIWAGPRRWLTSSGRRPPPVGPSPATSRKTSTAFLS
jgi:acetoacetate decarboxylase